MKRRLILPITLVLYAGQSFAGDLQSGGTSVANGFPASPHQAQVLGLSKSRSTEGNRSDSAREGLVNTYKGFPASRHQLEVFGVRSKLAVQASVTTAIAIIADGAPGPRLGDGSYKGSAREAALLFGDIPGGFLRD